LKEGKRGESSFNANREMEGVEISNKKLSGVFSFPMLPITYN
jgi:hypothetical protein